MTQSVAPLAKQPTKANKASSSIFAKVWRADDDFVAIFF